ncbi:MAG TPA: DUF5723 family protein, partial [Dyadobacter sp.]|nr:DUF5723 family protein [Dyadobacter sp.]
MNTPGVWFLFCLFMFPVKVFSQGSDHFFSTQSGIKNNTANPAALLLTGENRWSANMFSIRADIKSNTASVNIPGMFGGNFLRGSVLGTSAISTGSARLLIQGPSLAYKVNSKTSVSLGTSARLVSNYWNVDTRLLSEIGEVVKEVHDYPYFLKNQTMKMNTSVYSDLAFSVSHVLWQNERHQLTGGIAIKYINGIAHSSAEVQELSGTIKRINSYLTSLSDASGSVSTATSGKLLSDVNLRNFLKGRPGIGSDLGLTYSFGKTAQGTHKFWFGVSITDLGHIRYRADPDYSKSYDINVPVNKGLYFNNNFNNSSFSQSTRVFDRYPEFFNKTSSSGSRYNVGLPTTTHLQADYQVSSDIYVSAFGTMSMRKKNVLKNLYNYNCIGIIPRLERKNITLHLPFTFQEYTGLSVGAG